MVVPMQKIVWMAWVGVIVTMGDAQTQGNPWSFQAPKSVKPGQAATLLVTPHVVLKSLELTLRRDGKEIAQKRWPNPRKGRALNLRWKPPIGQSDWSAQCVGTYEDGRQTSEFKFRILSIGPLKIKVSKRDVHFEKGSLFIHSNQGLTHADIVGYDVSGTTLFDERVDLGGRSGRLEIRFPTDTTAELKKLELKVVDLGHQWTSFRFVNWYLEIEQDQVEFESGKWELRPQEAMKINPVIKRIDEEIKRYQTDLGSKGASLDGLKLYVAGCTDTVGGHADNFKLSKNQARIATCPKEGREGTDLFCRIRGDALAARRR